MPSLRMRPLLTRAQLASTWLWTPERRWLLLLAAALVALGTFLEISTEVIEDDELTRFDGHVLTYVAGLRRPWLTVPFIDITALGSVTLVALVTGLTCLLLLRLGDLRGAVQLVVAVCGAATWVVLTKRMFARARPDVVEHLLEVQSFSFPSGHASGSAALYVTVAVVLGRHLARVRDRLWLLACTSTLAILIGFSRIYLGVHYPSDVASGLAFGGGWALLLSAAFEWRRVRGMRPIVPTE
ncbi:MAG: phosphatase PAP2 family protein [Polyangiales bacterium]